MSAQLTCGDAWLGPGGARPGVRGGRTGTLACGATAPPVPFEVGIIGVPVVGLCAEDAGTGAAEGRPAGGRMIGPGRVAIPPAEAAVSFGDVAAAAEGWTPLEAGAALAGSDGADNVVRGAAGSVLHFEQ